MLRYDHRPSYPRVACTCSSAHAACVRSTTSCPSTSPAADYRCRIPALLPSHPPVPRPPPPLAHCPPGKAGGFLALDWNDGSPVGPLARLSYGLHRRLAGELGQDVGYRDVDTLQVWRRLMFNANIHERSGARTSGAASGGLGIGAQSVQSRRVTFCRTSVLYGRTGGCRTCRGVRGKAGTLRHRTRGCPMGRTCRLLYAQRIAPPHFSCGTRRGIRVTAGQTAGASRSLLSLVL